jgi:hypothetical protein
MAKKNKKAVEEAAVEVLPEQAVIQAQSEVEPAPEQQDEPKQLSLKETEVLSLKLYEAETRAATYAATIRQMEREAYLRKIDPENKLGKLEEEFRGYAKKANDYRNLYQRTITNIETRVGISMKDYTYDDDTGMLHPVAS